MSRTKVAGKEPIFLGKLVIFYMYNIATNSVQMDKFQFSSIQRHLYNFVYNALSKNFFYTTNY